MTNEPSIWSDTPPSEPGDYHVRHKGTGEKGFGHLNAQGWFSFDGNNSAKPELYLQFGPRVLTAEETVALTAEVERLRQWKESAMSVLAEWDQAWEAAGKPGEIGSSIALATKDEIERLRRALRGTTKPSGPWLWGITDNG
jgi:hypothetical protein